MGKFFFMLFILKNIIIWLNKNTFSKHSTTFDFPTQFSHSSCVNAVMGAFFIRSRGDGNKYFGAEKIENSQEGPFKNEVCNARATLKYLLINSNYV